MKTQNTGWQPKQRIANFFGTKMLATQNTEWGFWGTMEKDAAAAWPLAMTVISDLTLQPLESVRLFLDSRYGRHFADEVRNHIFFGASLEASVKAAAEKWQAQTISRAASKFYGIPKGLPYLTGFVLHVEIEAQ